MDCIVVGYHEAEPSGDELALELTSLQDLPVPLSNVLRTRVRVGGRSRSYLEALSHLRGSGGMYTVAELPSLGTFHLTSFLRKHGHSATIVNSFTYEQERLVELLRNDPRSVAITTTFYMMSAPVIEIVEFIRSHNETVPIVVGGPLVDNYCRDLDRTRLARVFDRMGADVYIWESQGEATLAEVVGALSRGKSVADVPNVFSRDGSGWHFSTRRPENNNLDECVVDWQQFGIAELGPTMSTRTARSCAFKCAFCDYPARAGALALAAVSTVEKELETLAAMGVRRLAFIDDTFNVPVNRFVELCEMMARRDFGIEWFSYFRCGNARRRSLYDLMYDAGCRGVLLGIESGDDAVLKSMDKKATTADYRFGMEQLKEHGIFTHASLVVGFPGESQQSVRNTIDFINSTGPDTFTVNHWYYLHSTPIHSRAERHGLTGSAHNWLHDTMTSKEAVEAADRMFCEIKSAWMSVSGLDFWGVPYLLGKGMSDADIVTFLRLLKPLTLVDRIRAGFLDAPAEEQALADLCAGLDLGPARYELAGAVI